MPTEKKCAKVYDPVHHANRKEVCKSIKDPEGKCLWDPDDDNGNQEAPAEAMVQQEQCAQPKAEEFIQAWDEPLTNEQALLVTDLFRSHLSIPKVVFGDPKLDS